MKAVLDEIAPPAPAGQKLVRRFVFALLVFLAALVGQHQAAEYKCQNKASAIFSMSKCGHIRLFVNTHHIAIPMPQQYNYFKVNLKTM